MQHAGTSDRFGAVSLILAGLGVLSWIISLLGQRRNRVVVPLVLLIIYAAMFFLTV